MNWSLVILFARQLVAHSVRGARSDLCLAFKKMRVDAHPYGGKDLLACGGDLARECGSQSDLCSETYNRIVSGSLTGLTWIHQQELVHIRVERTDEVIAVSSRTSRLGYEGLGRCNRET